MRLGADASLVNWRWRSSPRWRAAASPRRAAPALPARRSRPVSAAGLRRAQPVACFGDLRRGVFTSDGWRSASTANSGAPVALIAFADRRASRPDRPRPGQRTQSRPRSSPASARCADPAGGEDERAADEVERARGASRIMASLPANSRSRCGAPLRRRRAARTRRTSPPT